MGIEEMISTVPFWLILMTVLGSMFIGGLFGCFFLAAFMQSGDIRQWNESNRLTTENQKLHKRLEHARNKLTQTQDELRDLHESFNSLFSAEDAA